MDYLKGYENWLIEKKDASANTLSSYLRDVRQFLNYLSSNRMQPEKAKQRTLEQSPVNQLLHGRVRPS